MPTFGSHAVVGLAGAAIYAREKLPARFWVLSALCPVLPDFDVVAFALGIPYAHPFGHRGFFHSLFFAVLVGVAVAALFFAKERFFSRRWLLLAAFFALITATHGILDALTSGGLGVALLAPFDQNRYFFTVTPIQVAPIGIRSFFSDWGLRVIFSEFIWVWIPSIAVTLVIRLIRSRRIS